MSPALITYNLGPHHTKSWVRLLAYCTRNGVPERRPTAVRVKLGAGLVQWRLASTAFVDTLVGIMFVVFSSAWGFGTFLAEYSELLRTQYSLPFSVCLGNLVVLSICHVAGRSEQGAEKRDAGHGAIDDCALGKAVECMAEVVGVAQASKRDCRVSDCMEGA